MMPYIDCSTEFLFVEYAMMDFGAGIFGQECIHLYATWWIIFETYFKNVFLLHYNPGYKLILKH